MTIKQATARERLQDRARPMRLRIAHDSEGFPVVPGRYGRVEWFNGRDLVLNCDQPRLFATIWVVPGVRRHQSGDHEMRAILPPEAFEQVAAVIRAKRWGGSGRGYPANLVVDAGQTATSAA